MSERLLEDDISELIQLSKRTLDTVERLEKTLRGFMEYTQKPMSKRETVWRQSKNPEIEWCPEQEASAEDVAKAKNDEEKDIWYRGPQGSYTMGSIFRRKPQK